MASSLLIVHSVFRWLVLAFGLYAVAKMAAGQSRNAPFTPADRIAQRLFISALDLQFLFGLVLFGISPVTRGAMKDIHAAMRDSNARFFVTEHWVFMVVALVVAHLAMMRSKSAKTDHDKFKLAGLGFALALGLILAGIPWFRLTGK